MQDQSNQTNPQPTPEDTAQNASTPASQEAGNGQQESGWKQKIQTLLKKCTIPFVIVGALFLIVGVPIIINELYKRPGYVTMWSAADMLGYYGTLLGAFVGIATLVMTIWFTRCQIQRESYLQSEKEKWDEIRNIFAYILDSINPLKALLGVFPDSSDPMELAVFLKKYQINCRTSTDKLKAYLSKKDEAKVSKFILSIETSSKKYYEAANQATDVFFKLSQYKILKNAQDQLRKFQNDLLIPDIYEFVNARKEEYNSNKIPLTDMNKILVDFENQMKSLYEEDFLPLMEQHRASFEEIENHIQIHADTMLYFWRKH